MYNSLNTLVTLVTMNKKQLAPQNTKPSTKDIVKGIVNNPKNKDIVNYLLYLVGNLKNTSSLELIGGNSYWVNSQAYRYSLTFEDPLLKDLPQDYKKNFGIFLQVRQRQNIRASKLVNFVQDFTDNEYFDLQIQDSTDIKYITISFSI